MGTLPWWIREIHPKNWGNIRARLLGKTLNIWPNRSAALLVPKTGKQCSYVVLLWDSLAFLIYHRFHRLLREDENMKNKSQNWPNTHRTSVCEQCSRVLELLLVPAEPAVQKPGLLRSWIAVWHRYAWVSRSESLYLCVPFMCSLLYCVAGIMFAVLVSVLLRLQSLGLWDGAQ